MLIQAIEQETNSKWQRCYPVRQQLFSPPKHNLQETKHRIAYRTENDLDKRN